MRDRNRYGTTKAAMVALFFAGALFLNGAASRAETIQTAATGQKNCYNEAGGKITCKGTGQDGEFQAGAQWPTARVAIDMIDGCWTFDNLTGLMWLRNAKQQCADNWITAMTYGETLSLCNYTDWRVANINEMESLVNDGSTNLSSWLGNFGFTNLQAGYYFSSTSYLNGNSTYPSPWSMSVQDGTGTGGPTVSSSILPVKSSTACILLVRGGYNDKSPGRVPKTGQTSCYDEFNAEETSCAGTGQDGAYQAGAGWSSTRFTLDDVTTPTLAYDQFTNLMWTIDSQTPGPDPLVDTSLDPVLCVPGETKTWQDALSFVKYCLNSATDPYLGYRDWRLPNKNELASLLDRSQAAPALPAANPFTVTDSGGRWTSTTYMRNTPSAWAVDLLYGDIVPNPKAGSQMLYIWPVRGSYPMLTVSTVSSEGSGAGTVTKSPSGAGCATFCDASSPNCCGTTEWPEGSERYVRGKKVTLTAKPAKGSIFASWSGYDVCEGKKGTCVVTMGSDDLVITANFASYPTAAISPASAKNFGKVKVSRTKPVVFTLRNLTTNGKQDLTISSITLTTGTDFSVPAGTNKCEAMGTLAAGKSCTFKVVFSPTATGNLSDVLTITSDDPVNPTITVNLTGQGI